MYDFGKLELYYISIILLFWNKNKFKKYCFEINVVYVNDLWFYLRFDFIRFLDIIGIFRYLDFSYLFFYVLGIFFIWYIVCIYIIFSLGEICYFCLVRYGKIVFILGWKKIYVFVIFKFFYFVVCKFFKLIVYWVF